MNEQMKDTLPFSFYRLSDLQKSCKINTKNSQMPFTLIPQTLFYIGLILLSRQVFSPNG